jgi:ATP-dependent DNA helicase RecG
MEIMVETTDGFRIADEDLKLRGPGAVAGTAQSGHEDFRFADLATDGLILAQAQAAAREIIAEDPELSSEKWSPLRALMTGARLETEIAKVA